MKDEDYAYETWRQQELDNKPESMLSLLFRLPPPLPLELRQPLKGKGNPCPDNVKANKAKQQQAFARYVKAIGKDWATTIDIENHLGMGRGCAYKVLTTYWQKGLLNRRPFGGEVFNRRKGWEWSVKC